MTDKREDAGRVLGGSIKNTDVAVNKNIYVSRAQGEALAKDLNAFKYLECSSQLQVGIDEIFAAALEAAVYYESKRDKKLKYGLM